MINLSSSGNYYQALSDKILIHLNHGGSGINQYCLQDTNFPSWNILKNSNYTSLDDLPGIPFTCAGRVTSSNTHTASLILASGNHNRCFSYWDVPSQPQQINPSGNFAYAHFFSSGVMSRLSSSSTYGPNIKGSGITNVFLYEDRVLITSEIDSNGRAGTLYEEPIFLRSYYYEVDKASILNKVGFASGMFGGMVEKSPGSADAYMAGGPILLNQYLDFESSLASGPSGQITFVTHFFQYPSSGIHDWKYDHAINWSTSDGAVDNARTIGLSYSNFGASPYFVEGKYSAVTMILSGPSGSYSMEDYRTDFAAPDPLDGGAHAGQIHYGTSETTTYGDFDEDGYNEMIGAYAISPSGATIEVEFDVHRGYDGTGASGDFIRPKILVKDWSLSAPTIKLSDDNGATWSTLAENVDYYWSQFSSDANTYILEILSTIGGRRADGNAPLVQLEGIESENNSFPLFAHGMSSGIDDFPIYEFGANLLNESFPVYISGRFYNEFYIFTYGHDEASGNFPIYNFGIEDWTSGNFPIYQYGHDVASGTFPIFEWGFECASGDLPIYSFGAHLENYNASIYLDTVTEQSMSGVFGLYIKSEPSGSFPIYVAGSGASGTPIFGGIDLYLCSVGGESSLSLFLYNSEFQNSTVMSLYTHGRTGPPPDFPLFLKAPDWADVISGFSLYTVGYYGSGIFSEAYVGLFIAGSGLSSPSGDYPSEDGSKPIYGDMSLFLYNQGVPNDFPIYMDAYGALSGTFPVFIWSAEGITSGNFPIFVKGHAAGVNSFAIYTLGYWYYG